MLVRFALVGLAVAGLASPAGASEATPETASAQNEGASLDNVAPVHTRHQRRARRLTHTAPTQVAAASEPAEAADQTLEAAESAAEAPKPKRIVRAKPKPASVLPPERPGDIAPASEQAAAEPATAAPAAPVVVADAAPQPAPVISAKTPTFVNIMPPLRPSFASDEPVVGSQTADAGPASVTVPDGVGAPTAKFVYVMPPARPTFSWDVDNGAALPGEITAVQPQQQAEAPQPAAPVQQQPGLLAALFSPAPAQPAFATTPDFDAGPTSRTGIEALVAKHARLNGIPVALVHRVVMRESRYNPRAVGHGGALGLMQIKHATARGLGYTGPASGLLDADTNLTYAVKYLAGAYRTAGGDFSRAVAYYARGYYYAAKHAGTMLLAGRGRHGLRQEAEARAEDVATAAQ